MTDMGLEQLIKEVLEGDGVEEGVGEEVMRTADSKDITPKNGKLEQLSLVEISPTVVGALKELVASNESRVAGQRGMKFILNVVKEWLHGLND